MILPSIIKSKLVSTISVGQEIVGDTIFESNFANDTGFYAGSSGNWNGDTPASGFDGVKAGAGTNISVVPLGVSGNGNAMKFVWDAGSAQPTASLGKHLSGNKNTGYDEIYIRYRVKFPNNIKLGHINPVQSSGIDLAHWKWGRLWQNTEVTDITGWFENRVDSGYVVWNWNGNIPYTGASAIWSANEGSNLVSGSSGGERYLQDYYVSGLDRFSTPGYFEYVWPINTTDRISELEDNTGQTWHTVEWRFKLATSESSDDAVFEMWVDGESWGVPARLLNQGGAPVKTGVPTARRGSGFNYFTFFDNIVYWHNQWDDPGVDGYLLVDDVVVSKNRIGHTYVAGNIDNIGAGAT